MNPYCKHKLYQMLGAALDYSKSGEDEVHSECNAGSNMATMFPCCSVSISVPFRGGGFTLIETLVALAAFSLVLVGFAALITTVVGESGRQQGLLFDQDSSRRVIFTIAQELRNSVPSNTGSYQIEQAGAQQLIFYSNINGGATIERVRYFLSGTELRKGVVIPTGSPLVYNLGSETITTVQKNVGNGANAVFQYFTGDFTGSQSPLSQPVNATAVRHVKINLSINKTYKGNTATYNVAGSATIRSIKDNLGD